MFLQKIQDTITKYSMLTVGEGIVVALSGGADSVALLIALHKLKKILGIDLFAFHLNHCLRGEESMEDASFCAEICEKYSIPLYKWVMDVREVADSRKINLEEAGRKARHVLYRRALNAFAAEKIATGHHMNDQAETVIINFLRGSGDAGLSGLDPVYKGWLIRPLIDITREEILEFLKAEKIVHREDSSNQNRAFIRNSIRHELIPFLQEKYNPNIVETLCRTASIMSSSGEQTQSAARQVIESITTQTKNLIEIDKQKFNNLHIHIRRVVLREVYNRAADSKRKLGFAHIESILDAASSGTGSYNSSLPEGISIKITADKIIVSKEKDTGIVVFERTWTVPGIVNVEEIGKTWKAEILKPEVFEKRFNLLDSSVGAFPAEKIIGEITVRNRTPGDRLQPLGMNGTKKLKDILIDKKIKRDLRDSIPVFTTEQGEIFWVPGITIDDKYKVDENTDDMIVIYETGGADETG